MAKKHTYSVDLRWTGNRGSGTSSYRDYDRTHEFSGRGRPVLPGSSDAAFRGDATRYNPEDLLVASASSCHMLWYLHLCADAGVVVSSYGDHAEGEMIETEDGGGHFVRIVLRPYVTLQNSSDKERAERLHEEAHHLCYIARSVNFPILCEPTFHSEKQ